MKKKERKIEKNKVLYGLTIAFAGVVLSAVLTVSLVALTYNGGFLLSGGAAVAVGILTLLILTSVYFHIKTYSEIDPKNLLVMMMCLLITFVASAAVLRNLSFKFVPFSLLAMLAVLLMGKKEAYSLTIANFFLCLLILIVYNKFVLTTVDYATFIELIIKAGVSLLIIYVYKVNFNRIKFILIGLVAGALSFVANFLVEILFSINAGDAVSSLTNSIWMALSVLISTVVSLVLTPIIEWTFRMDTNMQLLEYISFDQPLLKELNAKAPGTYNHCIKVGNLAERCAFEIGENVNLAKAAAYYHDIGKIMSPEYFSENQNGGPNPHDDLIFETSVKILTRHTTLGYKILTEKKFPKIICDVALEHHGTSPLNYFYYKALSITEGDVESDAYRYQGPKPSNRISAIVMIADSTEAAFRAHKSMNREELTALVDGIIKDKREDGQFDDCNITMKQLSIIKETLVDSLIGDAHQRIKYPKKNKK